MPHQTNQPRHPRHATTATQHYKPSGWRDHQVAPVAKAEPDVGMVAKELKVEANGGNAKTGMTLMVIILGGLIAYSVFYQG
jgi:hypothetical protein